MRSNFQTCWSTSRILIKISLDPHQCINFHYILIHLKIDIPSLLPGSTHQIFKTLDLHQEINFLSSLDPHQDIYFWHSLMQVMQISPLAHSLLNWRYVVSDTCSMCVCNNHPVSADLLTGTCYSISKWWIINPTLYGEWHFSPHPPWSTLNPHSSSMSWVQSHHHKCGSLGTRQVSLGCSLPKSF